MPETRLDPDALLRELKRNEEKEHRGRLKIFLGAAAGVGKTFAMLTEAQEQIGRGVDVVSGYIEPHGRKETERLAEGIERVPFLNVEHRGVTVREFDLDAALKRRPSIILVDELAHTNAPGLRHPKRWMDVDELLRNGINVYTTVNIQHIESLNDVIAQITGVIVRETIPDSFFEQADEIELVDLPPDELLQRLQEGKIYVPGQAERAMQSFFRKGNLIALRDLALRLTAERVEAEMQSYRTENAVRELWAAGQRVLVCIAPNQLAQRVVRVARRTGTMMHAKMIAVYVENSRSLQLSPQSRQLAQDALELAESLGMETVVLRGSDIVAEVLNFARQRNVTLIVVGKPVKPRWREIVYGSVVDELVRHSGNIDVHVITGTGEEATPTPKLIDLKSSPVRSYLRSIGIVGLATLVSLILAPHVQLSVLIMVYLLGVAVLAMRNGPTEAVSASVLSVLVFSALFVPEDARFGPRHAEFLITFAMMLLVALMLSSLALRLRLQAAAANERERRSTALYALTRELSRSRSKKEIAEVAADRIRRAFEVAVSISIVDEHRKLMNLVASPTQFELEPSEAAVAQWAFDHGERAGKYTTTLPGAKGLYLPMKADNLVVGVVGIEFERQDRKLEPAQMDLLETFVAQTALAVERTIRAKESQQARLSSERDRIRESILRSVSRDLREPVAMIEGAAAKLIQEDDARGEERSAWAQTVLEGARQVDSLMRNLLDMTRIESGAIDVERASIQVETLIEAALIRTRLVLGERPIQKMIEPNLPRVIVDEALIEQVLVNLLENAASHTPQGTLIEINASCSQTFVTIEIADRGPGIPAGEQDRIFDKFYRVGEGASPGFGLGLTICRAIIDAHGGKIYAENRFGGGASFFVELPYAVTNAAASTPAS